ncbi:MAG: YiiX/YebB-like N1pC/P60 family cysteine hydrolase [Dysgonamonadaceae bacterium]
MIRIKSGDLLFTVGSGNSELLQAIQNSTSNDKQLPFTHVGILEITNKKDTLIIEATTPEGVIITPIKEFFNKTATLNNKKLLVVGRLKPNYQYAIPQAIENAKYYLGSTYDYAYDEENADIYCSELVRFSFKDSTNGFIFDPIAMTFKNQSTGQFDAFWVESYNKMGLEIPEGKNGTNPSDMFTSNKIEIVHTFY